MPSPTPINGIDENPYASPQSNCLREEELATVLRRAVIIFRRMGCNNASR